MKTKLCAMMLSLTMVLAALTGCGSNGGSTAADSAAPDSSAPAQTQETEQAPQEAVPAVDSAEEGSAQ